MNNFDAILAARGFLRDESNFSEPRRQYVRDSTTSIFYFVTTVMSSSAGRRHRHEIVSQRRRPYAYANGWLRAACAGLLALLLLGRVVQAAEDAPDFTLKSVEGENLRLKDYRGSVVILSFIQGRCRSHCEEQLRALQELHERYNPVGLQILGISSMSNERAAALREELKLDFPILLDKDQQATQQYQATLMPTLVLVDKDGRRRFLHQDYRDADEQQYETELRQLLKEWQ